MNSLKAFYLIGGIVIAVCFVFSLVGLVLNCVFMCRKKTNFQVRLFAYFTVILSLTISLGAFSIQFLVGYLSYESIDPDIFDILFWILVITEIVFDYCVCVGTLIICSINMTLLRNICTYHFQTIPWRCGRNQTVSCLRRTEAIFITLLFVIPFPMLTAKRLLKQLHLL